MPLPILPNSNIENLPETPAAESEPRRVEEVSGLDLEAAPSQEKSAAIKEKIESTSPITPNEEIKSPDDQLKIRFQRITANYRKRTGPVINNLEKLQQVMEELKKISGGGYFGVVQDVVNSVREARHGQGQ